jgi:hypothetical protein
MKKINILFILIFCLSLLDTAFSLPRFSLRQGDNCISCHYNPTGGEMRNEGGWYFGKNIISMILPSDKEFMMSPRISDNISLGIDYRTQLLYSGQKEKLDFQQMTGAIYTHIGFSKKIDAQARYDFVNQIWEGYAVARILPNNSYIKAGSFIPNFGIRIDDHTAYTRGGDFGLLFSVDQRQGLIYNPFYTEAGAELGIYVSDWVFLTTSAGSNLFNNTTFKKDPTYTTRLELTPKIGQVAFSLGGSYAAAKIPRTTDLYGGFFGFGFDRFSLLGEYDISNNLVAQDLESNAIMVEAAVVIVGGLEAVVRYDRWDPDKNISKDEISHVIVGFEFFPYSFVEIRPQYRFVMEDPSVTNDSFVLQFHFWY